LREGGGGLGLAAARSDQLREQSARIKERAETVPDDGARTRIHGSRIGPRGKTYADLNLKTRRKK
jgi:hypothetical protein